MTWLLSKEGNNGERIIVVARKWLVYGQPTI